MHINIIKNIWKVNANCFASLSSMSNICIALLYKEEALSTQELCSNRIPAAGMNVSVTSGNDSVNFSQTISFDDENLKIFTNPDLLVAKVQYKAKIKSKIVTQFKQSKRSLTQY